MASARNILGFVAAVVLAAAHASAQSPEIGYGADVILRNRLGQAVGSDGVPLRVAPASGAGAQSVSVTNFPATQPVSGTVAISNLPATQPVSGTVSVSNLPAAAPPVPNRGVAAACTGAGTVGTTSTAVCAAGAARSYLAIQNQSDTAVIYCNLMGGTATTAPPSRKLLPNASLVQGNAGGGFVSTAAINCIATAAATPISAEVLQ